MKSFIKYHVSLIILIIFVLVTSCNDYLDIKPLSEFENTYFENEYRVERGIGAVYAENLILWQPNFPNSSAAASNLGAGIGNYHRMYLLPGDEITTSNQANTAYEAFVNVLPTDAIFSKYWSVLYCTIARANFMLDILTDPEVQEVITTPGYGDWARGECLFLRSYCNFRLWNDFRKAPNQKTRISTMDATLLEPTHGFELLDQAIADLKEAENLLPDSWDEKNKGRVFKNSARGLLVKAYSLRANFAQQFGGDSNADYQNAIQAFNRIDVNVSTIEGISFGNNFDYRKENNKESLYEPQASRNPGKEDNPYLNVNKGGDAATMGVCYSYFWAHNLTDWACGSKYGPSPKLLAKFDQKDPRFSETIYDAMGLGIDPTYTWLGTGFTGNKPIFNGYQFIKYINGSRRGDLDPKYNLNSYNNPRALRLADVKLLVAEAYLQTGNEPAARQQVNDIRRRARKSTRDGVESSVPADYTIVTMKNIMDERMFELCGEEDIRWTDMRRWHAAGYIKLTEWAQDPKNMWGYDNILKTDPLSFDETKHLLWPIPWEEIKRNPKMQQDGQNPGYN